MLFNTSVALGNSCCSLLLSTTLQCSRDQVSSLGKITYVWLPCNSLRGTRHIFRHLQTLNCSKATNSSNYHWFDCAIAWEGRGTSSASPKLKILSNHRAITQYSIYCWTQLALVLVVKSLSLDISATCLQGDAAHLPPAQLTFKLEALSKLQQQRACLDISAICLWGDAAHLPPSQLTQNYQLSLSAHRYSATSCSGTRHIFRHLNKS